jgi:hypothetical protein
MPSRKIKFGKLPSKRDRRTLKLTDYIVPNLLPTLPPMVNYESVLPAFLGILGNDQCLDCCCAAASHLVMSWTMTALGNMKIIHESETVAFYAAITGFDPVTKAGDNGTQILNVMNHWRSDGIAGDRIDSFSQLNHKNIPQVRHCIYQLGGVIAGFNLPDPIAENLQNNIDWHIPPQNAAPNLSNAHAVPIIGYDAISLAFISFGRVNRMGWDFYQNYCVEAFAAMSSQDWLINTRPQFSGLNLAKYNTDLASVTA